jgi:hypothetical protein
MALEVSGEVGHAGVLLPTVVVGADVLPLAWDLTGICIHLMALSKEHLRKSH